MDCVLGYHLNPLTCGIAKFNLSLARRLGIPVLKVFDPAVECYRQPLLSIKISEFKETDIRVLDRWLEAHRQRQSLRLFFHAFSETTIEHRMIRQAEVVYCGNAELVAQLRRIRSDVVEAWCPGTIFEARRFNPAEISVFSFGMAHKVRTDYYHKLQTLLERTGKSYRLYLSTALHDGTSFDDSFAVAFGKMREIFHDNIYFLGYLSDTAIYNYLTESTFFAAFFDKGVRANNTSVNAAMQCGSVVITNLDEYSPAPFVHLENLVDIRQCGALPVEIQTLVPIRERAKETAMHELGWDMLMSRIMQEEALCSSARPRHK